MTGNSLYMIYFLEFLKVKEINNFMIINIKNNKNKITLEEKSL